jgi:3-oxoacyl-[acyl-carrier protein] reductase
MAGRLDGRVALVIGAARGIGAGIAEALAEEGARLLIADVLGPEGEATARRLSCLFAQADVSRKADDEALVALALERFGRLDVLVQNAGIFPQTAIDDIAAEEWDRVLAVNLRGVFLAFQAALPVMKRQRYGRCVFTSSITGPRVSSPGHAHYAASKAGINGFIRSAALEAAPFGITVNGVEPGNILTEGVTAHRSPAFIAAMEASIPLGRLGTPRDVALAVRFLASDEAAYITGTTIVIDGGQILSESKA